MQRVKAHPRDRHDGYSREHGGRALLSRSARGMPERITLRFSDAGSAERRPPHTNDEDSMPHPRHVREDR